jgi:hypothetical protein
MKPKQYQKEFDLLNTDKFDRTKFCSLLMEDFTSTLNTHPKMNVTHFKNEVENIKNKFDRIFNGTKLSYDDAEKFWKYIFAVKIVPIRNTYFVDWKKANFDHRYATDRDFAIRYDSWNMHKEEDEWLEQELRESSRRYWQFLHDRLEELINGKNKREQISKAKEILGIGQDEIVTNDLVSSQFRMLAKSLHPDVHPELGEEGAQKFNVLVESKNILIQSIS